MPQANPVSEEMIVTLLAATIGLLAVTDDPANDADPEESIFPFARAAVAAFDGTPIMERARNA